jgi:hypothetical protein
LCRVGQRAYRRARIASAKRGTPAVVSARQEFVEWPGWVDLGGLLRERGSDGFRVEVFVEIGTAGSADDEVHELPWDHDRLADLQPVQVRLHPRRGLRPRDERLLGQVRVDLETVTHLPVHLDDELEGLAL